MFSKDKSQRYQINKDTFMETFRELSKNTQLSEARGSVCLALKLLKIDNKAALSFFA